MQNEIRALLEITKKLKDTYHLDFPLDGRLVGDIGEALVKQEFNVELLPKNTKEHDAYELGSNKLIQIKSSMKYNFSFSYKCVHQYYMAVHINEDATLEVIYNGPGKIIKDYILKKGLKDYNKTWYTLSKTALLELNKLVKEEDRINKRDAK